MISLKTIKRITILVVGGTVLAIGVAFLVLPGPAFIVIPAGLAILAIEFAWARRWLRKARGLLPNKKSSRSFPAFVARHTRNFLESASVRPHERSKTNRMKGQKDERHNWRENAPFAHRMENRHMAGSTCSYVSIDHFHRRLCSPQPLRTQRTDAAATVAKSQPPQRESLSRT